MSTPLREIKGRPKQGHGRSAPCREATLTAIRSAFLQNCSIDVNAISDLTEYSAQEIRRQARVLVTEGYIMEMSRGPLTWMAKPW